MKGHEPMKQHHLDADVEKNLAAALAAAIPKNRDIVFLCIGTDRSTGDALGPFVGTGLRKLAFPNVHGTLRDPVHAMNLKQTLLDIPRKYANPFVVAVDACLGNLNSVGYIQATCGPIKPGAGVNKDLPPVGEFAIHGIVNVGGFMEYLVLQNTRLSLVTAMADVIVKGIYESVTVYRKDRKGVTV
jgi:putative sporulation protein YyaC